MSNTKSPQTSTNVAAPYIAGWEDTVTMLMTERVQSKEEGKDPSEVDRLCDQAEALLATNDHEDISKIWAEIITLPLTKDFSFVEPNDLKSIRALRTNAVREHSLPYGDNDEALLDRLNGAWLGRCAGCALGKPVEMYMHPNESGMNSRERIKKFLVAVSPDEYPINNYLPGTSPAEAETGKLGIYSMESTREQIKYMQSDDDIRYTVLGQQILMEYGLSFDTFDLAKWWSYTLPYGFVCTAETQAYRNFSLRYLLRFGPQENDCRDIIDWNWVATHQNPYREWIGAQIRADSWGYATPGKPELAAELAWRDARFTHVKNGIYGEMFCAAMIAAAFALDDPKAIVMAGLAEIPSTSRLHSDMLEVIAICERNDCDFKCFEKVLDEIWSLLGHYHPVHTNNNAGLVVASLLLGGDDLEKVLSFSVMGGWDTDCNGATAGSIAGAMLGKNKLPTKWVSPLNNQLNSSLIGYHPIEISECARRSLEIVNKAKS